MRDMNRLLRKAQLQPGGDVKEARNAWASFRTRNQWGAVAPLLTPPSSNVKLGKGVGSYGLSLAPDRLSGDYQVCPHSTRVCRAHCVAFAGKGTLPAIIAARTLKTRFLGGEPQQFITLLSHEIGKPLVKVVRLNTFSDITWEEHVPWLFEEHPNVQFYDYTKHVGRVTPPNYHLTYSASERTTNETIASLVGHGQNVAVVFSPSRTKPLPESWLGCPVVDGDTTDARYLDPTGVVVGLRAKGTLRTHPGGMVRNV